VTDTARARMPPPFGASAGTATLEDSTMFVAIEHDIHDPAKFQQCAEKVFPLPDDLHVHFFLPSSDLRRATCLYEAPSIERVRDFVDGALADSATQYYFPVAEDHAMGLPQRQFG